MLTNCNWSSWPVFTWLTAGLDWTEAQWWHMAGRARVPPLWSLWSVTRVLVSAICHSAHWDFGHHRLKLFRWKIDIWTELFMIKCITSFPIKLVSELKEIGRKTVQCWYLNFDVLVDLPVLLTLHCRTIWSVIYLLNYPPGIASHLITCYCFSGLHGPIIFHGESE